MHALANMPCVHCASRDTTLVASTSNRCLSSVPVQRVLECGRTHKQIRRQIKRSHIAVQRAFSQLDPNRPAADAACGDFAFSDIGATTTSTDTETASTWAMHGPWFRSCCLFELSCPGPSYSAESLPSRIVEVLDSKCFITYPPSECE